MTGFILLLVTLQAQVRSQCLLAKAISFFLLLFICSHVHTLFRSFLPPVPLPLLLSIY
jgi:hypothetical protein